MRRHLASFLAMGLAATCLSAQPGAPGWGPASENVLAIGAFEFEPTTNTVDYTVSAGASRYVTTPPEGVWVAPVSLPTGVLVTGLELQGCDHAAGGGFNSFLIRQSIDAGAEMLTPLGAPLSTGIPATPGCAQFLVTYPVPVEIDNSDGFYALLLQQIDETSGDLRFAGMRIRYRLQVSPAPGTATFSDVPTTHQFFQFVEALAAAGITAGCGGGNYCVDSPITRGEMAVFLSAALGLHFPN